MTIISKASRATVAARVATTSEESEFDGFWINVGVYTGEEADAKFVRLPRGIAVGDLKAKKVSDTMDPDFAAQVEMMNEMITAIQEACLTGGANGKPMALGESIPIQLSAVLYRRKEEVDAPRDASVAKSVRSALFGKPAPVGEPAEG